MRFYLGWCVILALLAVDLKYTAACTLGEYDKCPDWDPCSKSCGGGRQCRTCESCAWSIDKEFCQNCNEFCYNGHQYIGGRCQCPTWRIGDCCETCRHIYIDHCKYGQQRCRESPDSIMCTDCEDPYYSGGYDQGCLDINAVYFVKISVCSVEKY